MEIAGPVTAVQFRKELLSTETDPLETFNAGTSWMVSKRQPVMSTVDCGASTSTPPRSTRFCRKTGGAPRAMCTTKLAASPSRRPPVPLACAAPSPQSSASIP
eukprot:5882793-Prymnesium_polylepis.1